MHPSITQQTTPEAFQELRALSNLILRSLDNIDKFCATIGEAFPSTDERFTLTSELVRLSPEIVQESGILVGAASQLIAAIRPSPANVLVAVLGVCFQ